jgi:hypothetical protein
MRKYGDSVASQLVVVAEAEVDDMADQGEQVDLIPAIRACFICWVVIKGLPEVQKNGCAFSTKIAR